MLTDFYGVNCVKKNSSKDKLGLEILTKRARFLKGLKEQLLAGVERAKQEIDANNVFIASLEVELEKEKFKYKGKNK